MSKLKFILYCFGFFLLSSCEEEVVEPTLYGNITGKVVNAETGNPLSGVTITTSPVSTSLLTDTSGKFSFPDLVTGTYAIRCALSGYSLEIASVNVAADETVDITIQMSYDTLGNTLPLPPAYLLPANAASDQSVNPTLKWRQTTDADNDGLHYMVLLYASGASTPDTVASNITDTTVVATALAYNTVYFWQILTFDGSGQTVYGPVWHFETTAPPDNRILFARKEGGKYDIWSINQAGTSPVKLTSGGSNHWRPRWSPNRAKIAFLSDAAIDPQIFTMNADGSNIQQITQIPMNGINLQDIDFSWSPDGSALVYMNGNKMYKINANGTGLALLTEAPVGYTFTELDWNGFTNYIAARVTGNNIYQSQILLYTTSGSLVNTVLNDNPGSTKGPQISIDGIRILYTHDDGAFDSPDGRQLDSRIKIKNLSTQAVGDASGTKLPGTNDLDARYSADGAKVIFVNTSNDGISLKSLWYANTDGTIRTKIIDNAEMPDWK